VPGIAALYKTTKQKDTREGIMVQKSSTPSRDRILGDQRIFQAVCNDLGLRHETVTLADGTKGYAYIYDGIDPYQLEDEYFPIVVTAIKSRDDSLKQSLVAEMPKKVTRFEVIDHTGEGRVLVKNGVKVELSLQDDDRTLKVFITEPNKVFNGRM
jgi:hypothetical protein